MYDWKKILVQPTDNLEKAIQVLDSEALRIVLVADPQGRLLGTVTDGDIRRALIKRLTMDTPLAEIMNRDPVTASINDGREEIAAMLRNNNLLQLPILDADRMIVGLETLPNVLGIGKIDNPVVLMAGGFGKRLRPLTDDIPKPLLKVGTKPILEIIIDQFIDAGFRNFYISTHYKAELVRAHFGDGDQWDVNIQYVHEETPLGTAGALGLLPDDLLELPTVMMNGDLLTKVNFSHLLNFHNEQDGIATMCVREYDFQVPYGVVEVDDHKVLGIVEKPVHKFFVSAGIYVLSPSLVKSVDGAKYIDMPQLLDKQIQDGQKVGMFPLYEYWLDIGRKDDYNMANEKFSKS